MAAAAMDAARRPGASTAWVAAQLKEQGLGDAVLRALQHEHWGQMMEAEVEYKNAMVTVTKLVDNRRCDAENARSLATCLFLLMDRKKVCGGSAGTSDIIEMQDMDGLATNLSNWTGSVDVAPEILQRHAEQLERLYDRLHVDGVARMGSPRRTASHDSAEESRTSGGNNRSQGEADGGATTDGETRSAEEHAPGEQKAPTQQVGTLLPPPDMEAGKRYVQVTIRKLGIKDSGRYVGPFMTVSIWGGDDTQLEHEQDTGKVTRHEQIGRYVHFGQTVHLHTPLDTLRREDGAIFFEFKHWKPDKKKISTRCWAMMEVDEIVDGKVVLELYKKPTDFTRKRVRLFTEKPLYLHLHVKIVVA